MIGLALLALVPFLWQPGWWQSKTFGENHAVGKPPNRGATGAQGTGDNERGSKDRPLVVDPKGHQDTPAETAQAKTEKQHASDVERSTLFYTGLTAWATFALCIVGLGGIIAAIYTLRAIETQSGIQSRSIELQERAMQQWVSYGNWRSEYRQSDGGRQLLIIDLNVWNDTNFPLTLPEACIRFEMGGVKARFEFRENNFLPPRHPYPVHMWFTITNEQATRFMTGGIPIRIIGDLTHVGSLGKPQEQSFCGVLWCHKTLTRFEEETPKNQNEPHAGETHSDAPPETAN